MSRRFSSSDANRRPGSLGSPYAIYSEILNADKSGTIIILILLLLLLFLFLYIITITIIIIRYWQ